MKDSRAVSQPSPDRAAFADCERIVMIDASGEPVSFVVLAVLTAVGNDFALACREEDLGDPRTISGFEYHVDDDGVASLAAIETEDLYEDVMHLFADLLGDEEA